jgi:hypothetical protein
MDASRPPSAGANDSWIPLPGLFAHSEIEASHDLEIKAHPLLIARGQIYYGVYVRERARDSQPGPARSAA